VKKSKHPYSGVKDRERRCNEVEVLKSLGACDYVITFADSWEHRDHLYIQTEFCEEGGLDVFLSQVGLKARLDDFRIWKILLELSLVSLDAFLFLGRFFYSENCILTVIQGPQTYSRLWFYSSGFKAGECPNHF
jgi:serine/threonine protein kinase